MHNCELVCKPAYYANVQILHAILYLINNHNNDDITLKKLHC